MIKLTGIWKNKDKNGKTYYSGKLNGDVKIILLPNSFKKEGDNSPDIILYLDKIEKEQQTKNNFDEDLF